MSISWLLSHDARIWQIYRGRVLFRNMFNSPIFQQQQETYDKHHVKVPKSIATRSAIINMMIEGTIHTVSVSQIGTITCRTWMPGDESWGNNCSVTPVIESHLQRGYISHKLFQEDFCLDHECWYSALYTVVLSAYNCSAAFGDSIVNETWLLKEHNIQKYCNGKTVGPRIGLLAQKLNSR
jgi:hypothetical protein